MRPSPDVVSRRIADDLVLVHLQTNRIYALNRTGARLWELLASGRTLDDARAALLAEFDVGPAELERELEALLERLAGEGLLVAPELAP